MRNVVNDDGDPRRGDGPHPAESGPAAIEFAFLDTQTFGDRDLQREVLELFVAQARRVVPGLTALTPREQADAGHLLKGSARGIGAWAAAAIADAYERADASGRAKIHPDLAATFAEVEAAIAAHLGACGD